MTTNKYDATRRTWRLAAVMRFRGFTRVRDLRNALAASGIHINEAHLWRICNGRIALIRFDMLLALCQVLNCGIEDLLTIHRSAALETPRITANQKPSRNGGTRVVREDVPLGQITGIVPVPFDTQLGGTSSENDGAIRGAIE